MIRLRRKGGDEETRTASVVNLLKYTCLFGSGEPNSYSLKWVKDRWRHFEILLLLLLFCLEGRLELDQVEGLELDLREWLKIGCKGSEQIIQRGGS